MASSFSYGNDVLVQAMGFVLLEFNISVQMTKVPFVKLDGFVKKLQIGSQFIEIVITKFSEAGLWVRI